MDSVDLVRLYQQRGWRLTPLAPASKRPLHDDWPRLVLPPAEVEAHVLAGGGVGLVLGEASGGVVDVDLDCAPAVAAAPALLPPTGALFGRATPTHRLYRAAGAATTTQYRDPAGDVLVELRSTGGQTVIPPSQYPVDAEHPAVEPCRWHELGDPAVVDATTLRRRVGALAAAALLARSWPARGGRHEASLALAGVLVRARVEWAPRYLELVAALAGDEEATARARDVLTTAARLDAGAATSGWPRFAEVFGAAVVERVKAWLALPDPEDPTRALDLEGVGAEPRLADDLEMRVEQEMLRERARREARRRLDAEARGPVRIEAVTLRALLAEPDPPVVERVARWLPADTRVVLAAARKAGKTTLVSHLVECLLDGGLFLGTDTVAPVAGGVALLDTEMSRRQLREWYAPREIGGDDRLHVATLRGRAGALDLLDRDVLATWAAWLRERQVEFVVVDCLRPVLDALGLDEANEAGRWLTPLDSLLVQAGVSGALVVHHMGHVAERSRGDSRIRDWPDVEWRLVRQDDKDDASPRFLSAYGRDVDVPETQLVFDPQSRRLVAQGGSRREAKTAAVLDAVLDALHSAGRPLSGRAIEERLGGEQPRDGVRDALRLGVREGALGQHEGPRNSHLYTPSARVRGSARRAGSAHTSECAALFIEPRTRALTPPSERAEGVSSSAHSLPPSEEEGREELQGWLVRHAATPGIGGVKATVRAALRKVDPPADPDAPDAEKEPPTHPDVALEIDEADL